MALDTVGFETVFWRLPIVIYPYLSGLVAGSFIVGTLSLLFGQKQYEPLTKLSLLATLALILFAPVGPLADAGQPSRWWELYVHPHVPFAPMGLFTFIWTVYVVVVVVEVLVAFRAPLCRLSQAEGGWLGRLYRWLSFGSTDLSERRLARDHFWLTLLGGFGVLLAFSFHGYLGFIFGAIKARPLWHNALMMPLFIVSAIVSGTALMIVVYSVMFRYFSRKRSADPSLIEGLMKLLMWLIFVDLFLDIVDLLNSVPVGYTDRSTSQGFNAIFMGGGPLTLAFWGGEIGLLLIASVLTWFPKVRKSASGASLTSLLVLISVWFMRYNTVVGGELQPKTSQGLVLYTPTLLGENSYQVVFGLIMFVLFVFAVLVNVLPWDDDAVEARLAALKLEKQDASKIAESPA